MSGTNSLIDHPAHYTSGGIEVWDFIVSMLTEEELRGYIKGNLVKYTARERLKGGNVDLGKAQWYLNKYLEKLEKERREVLLDPLTKTQPLDPITTLRMEQECTNACPECHHDAGLLP